MRSSVVIVSLGLSLSAACSAVPLGADPGTEGGPCIENQCLGGLTCLSGLCVEPLGSTGEPSDDEDDGDDNGDGADEAADDAGEVADDAGDAPSDESENGSAGSDDEGTSTTSGGESSTTTTAEDTTEGDDANFIDDGADDGSFVDEDSGDDGVGFIDDTDSGGGAFECDAFEQDCPPGEKCAAWANDGGSSWNALRCVPVADDPGQPGDSCTVEGNGVSGIDTCDVGSMCWDVDPRTNEGYCIALCTGSQNDPQCEERGTACVITNSGSLNLCVDRCDPLAQDCPPGNGCYGLDAQRFVCAPDASGVDGGNGDPCESLNACDEGSQCITADLVPGCQASGCCARFCDLDEGDTCPGAGVVCLPWAEEGEAFPGLDDVGICGLEP